MATLTDVHCNAGAVLDRHVEAGRGDKPAVIAHDATLTYDELRRQANRVGNLLKSLGVRREERVLLVLDDTSAFHPSFLGAMRIGAVPVPVSPMDKAENFHHYVTDSYARVVVADAAVVPRLQEALADIAEPLTYVATQGPAAGALSFDEVVAQQSDELQVAPTHADDMAFWLYSSGSTGRPKGVVHLHHDIGVTCECFAGQVLGLREDDICYSTTKLQHAYGLGNGLTFPLHFGATSVLCAGRPTPDAILGTLRRHKPTAFFSVPALYALLSRQEQAENAFASVRMSVSAAEALPPSTFDRFNERFGLEIVDGIGSTEMLHIFCSNRPGNIVRGSTGTPVPGYELRIVDETGAVLDGPAVGSLEVRGDSCAAFYWHQHEKSKLCMKGDWFVTGDRYARDEQDVYWYEGRADDMLKVGGLWVSPVDMENAIYTHDRVDSVGVVGVKIDDMSRVAAFVIRKDTDEPGRPDDDALAEELREWCKSKMRRYEYPHVVHFVEDMPRTLNGKVQRFRLRELAAQLAAT